MWKRLALHVGLVVFGAAFAVGAVSHHKEDDCWAITFFGVVIERTTGDQVRATYRWIPPAAAFGALFTAAVTAYPIWLKRRNRATATVPEGTP